MTEQDRAARALADLNAARYRLQQLDNDPDVLREEELAPARRALADAYMRIGQYLTDEVARMAAGDAAVALAQLAARDGA